MSITRIAPRVRVGSDNRGTIAPPCNGTGGTVCTVEYGRARWGHREGRQVVVLKMPLFGIDLNSADWRM